MVDTNFCLGEKIIETKPKTIWKMERWSSWPVCLERGWQSDDQMISKFSPLIQMGKDGTNKQALNEGFINVFISQKIFRKKLSNMEKCDFLHPKMQVYCCSKFLRYGSNVSKLKIIFSSTYAGETEKVQYAKILTVLWASTKRNIVARENSVIFPPFWIFDVIHIFIKSTNGLKMIV